MKYSFEDLRKIEHRKTQKEVFVFDEKTEHIEFISLHGNENLKKIIFKSSQNKLRYLDSGNCSIEKISFAGDLPNLQTLILHHNNLKEFVLRKKFPELELLDLSNNPDLLELKINEDLPKLQNLYAYQCNLKNLQIPAKLFENDYFDFNIRENENIESPPAEIVEQGSEAVRNYFRQIEKEKTTEYLFEAKVLIIGEGGAGKTSFAVKMKDKNAKLPKDKDTTEGVEITKWDFEINHPTRGKQSMFANLWDFGGQKLYQGTHQIFFSQKSFYVLLDDTREEKTDFAYWLNTVEQLAGEQSKLLIVVNKKHEHVPLIDKNGLRGRFGELISDFFTVNLKNEKEKTAEIEKLQFKLKNLLTELPGIGNELPASWVKIRKDLYEEKENCISYDRYYEICKNRKTDLKKLDLLSEYFNRIGVFMHYYDDALLKNRIFLNSNWLVSTVYEVLNHKIVKENEGKITKEQLGEIWNKDNVFHETDYLSRLMHRFGLMYEVRETKTFVVPAHLPAEQPYEKWAYENQNEILQFAFEFDKYMPRGIMPRIIVALHKFIENQKVWNRGVNIKHDGTFAEIKETYDKSNKFLIRIFGTEKKELLGKITHEFYKILDPFKKLHYEKLVPCICSVCKGNKTPYFFKHSELMDRKVADKKTIECGRKPFEDVTVKELLDGVTPPREYSKQENFYEMENRKHEKENSITVFGNGNVIGQDIKNSQFRVRPVIDDDEPKDSKKSKRKPLILIVLFVILASVTIIVQHFYPETWKILAPSGLVLIGFVAFWDKLLNIFTKSKNL
ncbi:MAG: hypothetical protein HN704_00665 [Bacteroidetes bacterium]|jgi:internalin A|nr:hypothetical protein [Bacteroidota bacterium]MBT6687008.1 hypothetical protein [Bacteroidota bacterium]MBT7144984.1 hypothetical protein [Bacteroidota bacterium]MBT7490096.1 hypothetical protein [Bacteroidota bacterium]